jgi:RNA polymerase sigma factor (sigma-70 family)
MAVCTVVRDWTTRNQRDAEMVRRALAGDNDAREELLGKYRTIFFAWCLRRYPHNTTWTEDCAQEGAIRLDQKLAEFRPERGAFGKWAQSVGRSAMFTFIRKRTSGPKHVSLDALNEDAIAARFGPEAVYVRGRVRKQVEDLVPEQGAAVGGCFYDDKTDEEIAEEEHIQRRKVNYRRHQGLRAMRKGLSDIPFMSIRPEVRIPWYSSVMITEETANESTQPGGEDGDS